MNALKRFWLIGFVLLVLASSWALPIQPASAAPKFPALSGRVVDEANILSPATEEELSAQSAALEAKTGAQFVVVTLASLQDYPIEDFGYQLGRAWGIGAKGKDDGILLIIAPNDRKVRVEVGYGLEGVITDAFSNLVLQRQVLPRFRTGDFEGGVKGGAQALIAQIAADPERQKAALADASQAAKAKSGLDPESLIWLIIILFWIAFSVMRSTRYGRRMRGGLASAAPVILWGGHDSHRGGFGGGGFGGGFGGGGGSFGGGGSSGSW